MVPTYVDTIIKDKKLFGYTGEAADKAKGQTTLSNGQS
jgi:hypothetical protein